MARAPLFRPSALLTLVLAAFSPALLAENDWVLRFDGLGPARIGMSREELAAVLGQTVDIPEDEDSQACTMIDDGHRPGVAYMITEGRLSRIDVYQGSSIATRSGARVGDPAASVQAKYGSALEKTPSFYGDAPRDYFLTYRSRDRRFALRFEIENEVVAWC